MIGKYPLVILFGPKEVYNTVLIRAQQEITLSGAVTLVPDDMDNSDKMTNFISGADRVVKIEINGIRDPISNINDKIARASGKPFEIWKYDCVPTPHMKGGHRHAWRKISVDKIT